MAFTVAVHGVCDFAITAGNNQLTEPGMRTPNPIVFRSADQDGAPTVASKGAITSPR